MPEIVQEVSSLGGSKPAGTGGAASRPIISQTFSPGESTRALSSKEGGSPTIEQTVSNGAGGSSGFKISESTRKMLDNLDKYGTVASPAGSSAEQKTESPPAAAGSDAAGHATGSPSEAPVSPAAAAAAPAPEPEKPAPAPTVDRSEVERYATRNRELVAEVERLKATPKSNPDARLKALDEAERMYLDDPTGALRRFIAVVHGIDDPAHKDVDSELSGLYQDLTARELKVPLDQAHQAVRESARTRQLLAREQRERKAERDAASAPKDESPEAQQTAQHTALIGSRLTSKLADGKSVGEAYPLTMQLAEEFHGVKPEALILTVLRDGFKTGEFDPKESDHKLIEQAAKKIETHYQARVDKIAAARPATSTAAPTQTPTATASKDAGQRQEARTITNASASVAPATPPAKQPDKPAPEDDFRRKRPGETEDQRRRRIAAKHLKD